VNGEYLTKGRILELFEALDGRMHESGIEATVFVVGGAAIALSVDNLRVTTDIDARYDGAILERIIKGMADDEGLPPDWLNNSINSTLVYFNDDEAPRTIFSGKMLSIQSASPEYILAMKLAARRPKDVDDILLLIDELELNTRKDILKIADKYFKADLSAAAWQRVQIEEFLDIIIAERGGYI
jgi:hypothetical protein